MSANFDRVARIYRWSEYLALGPLLVRTRNHFLPQLGDRRRAWVLGDGDGRFLCRLMQQNAELQATAVDTSARMLELLSRRCSRVRPDTRARLRTIQASALEVTPERATDLIVSHFLLDCLSQAELERLSARLAGATEAGTLWLVSDFALPRRRWLQPAAWLYVRSLYLAFRLLTGLRTTRLPEVQAALERAGFESLGRDERLGGLLYTELWRHR